MNIWEQMTLEVTECCNLDCAFCYNDSSSKKRNFMEMDCFVKIIDKAKDNNIAVHLSGGEPLTHPKIMEMLQYLVQKEVKFTLATNGILLTKEIINFLANFLDSYIQISLDGATADIDDKIRQSGHYNQVISVMNSLNEKGFKNGTIKMVVNQLNYNQIEEYFSLAKRYNFMPEYTFLIKSGRAKKNWEYLELSDELVLKLRGEIRKLFKTNREYIRMLKADSNFLDLYVKSISYTNECHFNKDDFRMFPLIRFDGSVQPCQGLRQEEYCIGNLAKQDIKEILSTKNKLLRDFLDKVRLRREKLEQDTCKKCTLNQKCGKGCIAESIQNGDFYGVSLKCEIRKKELLYKLKTLTGGNG